MRLPILSKGLSPLQKLQAFFIRRMMGYVPGPILMLSYRKRFFGRPYSRLIHQVLRKAEHWSLAELELMAAFISDRNSCQMCLSDHRTVASLAGDTALAESVLKDYRSAPISESLRSTLAFLEKLAITPGSLAKADLQPMLDSGLSEAAIVEAAEVCMIFATMNRIVDAFGFEIGPKPDKAGRFLLKNGYQVACLKG